MKNRILYIVIVVSALIFSSCNKFLDTVPDNRTDINTVEKLSKLVTSSYPDGNYAVMFNARVDFVSDKGVGFSESTINTDSFYWRDNDGTAQDTPDYLWSHCYRAIAHSNHAIEAAKTIDDPASEPFVAEAKLTRAFSHFILVSTFAKMYYPDVENGQPGVPYVDEPEDQVIKEYDRSTVAETYRRIEEDLKQGMADLGSDTKYTVPRYHFTVASSHAFAARFYLFKGDYDQVIAHASSVIPVPSSFTANGNVEENDAANIYAKANFQPWLTTFASAVSSNDIKIGYNKADNTSNLLLQEMTSNLARYANPYRYATKETDVTSTVSAPNPTGGSWAYRYYLSGDSYYVPKFYNHFVYTSINATSGLNTTIMPLFRNEEVLLNRAEAYAMKGELSQAIADLNVFMRQRIKAYSQTANVLTQEKINAFYASALASDENYMNKYNAYGSSSFDNDKKAVLMFIIDCKRNEFMWEGLRYWDMIRWKIPVTHITYRGESNTLYPDDDRWQLQIPETAELSGIELNSRDNLLSKKW